ncbi:MAG TPA: heme exporter protein CcmD [Pyrinomonadaceae bacterium]|nr:heme exporter protein CcmD [Pyrinomonadaceae bacterium]
MQWSSWSEFFSMGGFGFYVWGSYIVTFALLAGEVLMLLKRKRNLARREPHVESREGQLKASFQETP